MSRIGENLTKMFSLEGKVALITGAAGGLGFAISKGLSDAGAEVALCDFNLKGLLEAESSLNASGSSAASFELNLLDRSSMKTCVNAVMERFGHIDILVNCAGINKREGILDVEEETYNRIMNVNLKGTFMMAQEVVPHMIKAKNGGSVINIASINARIGLAGVSVYGATKGGVVCLTRCEGMEWAKHNIRANAICPGHVHTQMTNPTWTHPERSKYLLDRIAMHRPGKAEEFAGACVFLASNASSYMTGEAIYIDGGLLAGGYPWDYDTKW